MRAVLWSCEYACDGNGWNLPEVACEASGEASACGGSVSRSGRSGRARRLRGQQQASLLLGSKQPRELHQGPDQPECEQRNQRPEDAARDDPERRHQAGQLGQSDFPSQTSAIKSSVTALQSAVKALPSHPSATQLGTVATAAASLVSSVKSFMDATSSNCS